MNNDFSIRELNKTEWEMTLALVWNVFLEFEAPDYTEEGVREFRKSIQDEDRLQNLRIYGAFDDKNLLGVIATRSNGTHIALFFVDGKYHRRGIGKRLFEIVKNNCTSEIITVNSSPYAVPIYMKLGFCATDKEQVVNGLRFTPMERKGRS